MEKGMKKDFVAPIVVLTLICLVIAAALAITNNFTEPVITAAAAERAARARLDIIPEAEGFEPLPLDGMPGGVSEAYRTTNNTGYIFIMKAGGYGGDIEIICGITEDGKIITTMVLQHNETKGLGARVAEPAFGSQFDGKDSALEGVSAISGASISSKAYIGAMQGAFEAYAAVSGVSG